MPTQSGPGALAGAAEGDTGCWRELPDTTLRAPRLPAIRWLPWQRQIERICHVPRLVAGPLDNGGRNHSFDEALARHADFDSAVPRGGA